MPKKKIKKDKKMTVQHHKRVQGIPIIKHDHPEPGITKKEFMDVLANAVKTEGKNDKRNQETNG
jgi:hypothetical protein